MTRSTNTDLHHSHALQRYLLLFLRLAFSPPKTLGEAIAKSQSKPDVFSRRSKLSRPISRKSSLSERLAIINAYRSSPWEDWAIMKLLRQ
jgi:hypothetical protein